MAKGKQKKRAIGKPKPTIIQKRQTTQTKKTLNPPRKSARKKSTIIQKRQTTQTKKTLNPPRKSARKKSTIIQKGQTTQTKKNRPRKSIERFSNEASEIERDAANSTRPSASGTTAKIKMAQGSELETDDVWSVRMLVIAESFCKAVLTAGFVTFVLMNPDKVAHVLEQVLKLYGVVSGVSIGSIIIDLNCGSREKFLKFQKDFEDGKVKEALENELSKIGCDAKLKVTLMKVTRNVARTELRTVSQGESKAERESNQKVEVKKIPEGTDKANKEDIQLPSQKHKEDNSDAITVEFAHQATSKRKPPEVDVEVLEIENLPDHSEPWENIQRDFLPVHFLLLTVKDCEFLSCLSFLKEGFVKSNRKPLGIVYFGNVRDNKHEEVKVSVMKCNMGSSTTGGSLVVVPNAVRILRPKAVFSVGFCASLNEKKAELGDVVVCSKLITYASIKQEGDMVEEQGVKVPLNRDLATLARHIGDGWKPPVKYSTGQKVKPRRGGVFLSGPEVINDRKRRDALIKRYPEATAIEMEGEGLFVAAHDLDVEWIVIKGVSDFADGKKSETDLWRPFASVMAASLVSHTLKDSRVFESWPHFEDNSDVEDGSPRKKRRSSSSPSGSDPKRKKATAGESYAEDAQPEPSNQGEPRSIRPGDKAPTTYKASFKAGVPSEGELEHLTLELGDQWEQLGGRLGFNQAAITRFDRDHKGLNEKAFKMLIAWRKKEGADATYKVLYDALCDKRVQCKELAQQFCCE